jgi:hypothetical protein
VLRRYEFIAKVDVDWWCTCTVRKVSLVLVSPKAKHQHGLYYNSQTLVVVTYTISHTGNADFAHSFISSMS